MHFVGMSAITFYDPQDEIIPLYFRIDLTMVSLIAVMVCTLLGLWIGTRDKAFVQDQRDIVDSFIADMKTKSLREIRNIEHKHVLLWKTLFKNMPPLLIGGVLIATGVCVMHYIGMLAMVFDGYIVWNAGIVAASCLIALVAATAALWIMFRLLAMFPNLELLRFVCAVVMAIAVNGMHYTGMAAATFKYEAGKADHSSHLLVSVDTAVSGALIGAALFLSFVFVIAVSDLRVWYYNLSKMFFELDAMIEDALLEPSVEKRAEFLAAYNKFRQDEANDKAINEFRLMSRNFSKSKVKSNENLLAPDFGESTIKSAPNKSAKMLKAKSSLKDNQVKSIPKESPAHPAHIPGGDLEKGKISEVAEEVQAYSQRVSNI